MTMIVLMAVMGNTFADGIIAPASLAPVAAPIVAPAAIGYAKAVPQNIPPHAARIDINTRAIAAPYIAAAPYAVAPSAPIVAAPYGIAPAPLIAAPGVLGTTYAGRLTAPFAHLAAYGPAVIG